MPIYDYECKFCNWSGEKISKHDEYPICPKCENAYLERKYHSRFGINMGPVGAYGYYDETLGKYISTNKERKAEMQRQGVKEYPSPKVWFR